MTASAEICIVRYGQPQLEERCLDSVRRHTDLNRHALTVVDNFGRDRNLGSLWNLLIGASPAEFVCLLNSDTEVEPGWLDNLIAAARHTGADAVGPMSDVVGWALQRGGKSSGLSQTTQLSGFCVLLRREAWERAKGFREDFTFYGQESNFMRRIGLKIVHHGVFVRHVGGASVGAAGRKSEEKKLRDEFWRRNSDFDWSRRLAVLGLGPGVPGPLWRGVDEAIVEMDREGMTARHFDTRTVTAEELREFNPSVVITMSGSGRLHRCPELFGGLQAPRGLWFNDLRRAEDGDTEAWRGAFNRLFLCFDDGPEHPWSAWERAAGCPVSYMPQGSRINPELEPLDIQRELVFVGGVSNPRYHAYRGALLRDLGADHRNAPMRTPERLQIEAETPKLYRRSRFVLATSPKQPGYTSLRLYNILAYGGLALVDQFPGRERLFADEEHVLAFSTVDEARSVMSEWAARPGECERIRKRGWRLQQARHTVLRRLMNIVSSLTTPDQEFWGWL